MMYTYLHILSNNYMFIYRAIYLIELEISQNKISPSNEYLQMMLTKIKIALRYTNMFAWPYQCRLQQQNLQQHVN